MSKTALVTGVTGQDGAYLSELLLAKGYVVHGLKRRTSSLNTQRIDHLYEEPHVDEPRFILHHGEMTDTSNLIRLVQRIQPNEIYNLAAQSHVQVSFDMAEYTANVDALGTLRLLEAIRILDLQSRVRFCQALTSELYGNASQAPQTEATPFAPRSPYAAAKLYAYWITVNYREAYGLHASNAVLFNHESPLRGETFVSRKVTRGVAAIEAGLQEVLYLGNLDAKRDWGHARDSVDGLWRTMQADHPGDYVFATGLAHSVRDLVNTAFHEIGVSLEWLGSGVDEVGRDRSTGSVRVAIDPRYHRPTDVQFLQGDASKARRELGWSHKTSFEDLVREMVAADRAALHDGANVSLRRGVSHNSNDTGREAVRGGEGGPSHP
ncbi:MAG: GDP-mannose 4,6-dehydratase [Pseudomonadota bacterium]